MFGMRRRDFVALLGGGAATAWPLGAGAQQPALPVVAYLHGGSPEPYAFLAAALRQGLREIGYVEGQNVAIEFHWAEGHYERLPAMAADLVRRRVAMIVAGGLPAAPVAKAATSTIPIVFTSGIDPVQLGLVVSLNRPGGNMTGLSLFNVALDAKRVELLLEVAPSASTIAMFVNPNNPRSDLDIAEAQKAARARGKDIVIVKTGSDHDLDGASALLTEARADALLMPGEPLFLSRRAQLIGLAARHALPAIYEFREFAVDGGLMSYGMNLTDAYRKIVAVYIGRILNGAKPGDLPVVQPTKFELVINLKTAKTLGLTVPDKLLVAADEVIE
jgi:putative tryptophan/tyrosine transport system substrate-binding protein